MSVWYTHIVCKCMCLCMCMCACVGSRGHLMSCYYSAAFQLFCSGSRTADHGKLQSSSCLCPQHCWACRHMCDTAHISMWMLGLKLSSSCLQSMLSYFSSPTIIHSFSRDLELLVRNISRCIFSEELYCKSICSYLLIYICCGKNLICISPKSWYMNHL